jgi:hypothetical protein
MHGLKDMKVTSLQIFESYLNPIELGRDTWRDVVARC